MPRTTDSMIFYVWAFAHMCTYVCICFIWNLGKILASPPTRSLSVSNWKKIHRWCHALRARKLSRKSAPSKHHGLNKQLVNLSNTENIIQESQGCRSHPWCQLPLLQRHCCLCLHHQIRLHFLHLSSQLCSHHQEDVHLRLRFHLCSPASWWCLSCKGLVMEEDLLICKKLH